MMTAQEFCEELQDVPVEDWLNELRCCFAPNAVVFLGRKFSFTIKHQLHEIQSGYRGAVRAQVVGNDTVEVSDGEFKQLVEFCECNPGKEVVVVANKPDQMTIVYNVMARCLPYAVRSELMLKLENGVSVHFALREYRSRFASCCFDAIYFCEDDECPTPE